MKEVKPYIYKITFKIDGRVYIGSRFNSKGCSPDEFWVNGGYFTSSRHVKNLIKEYGVDVWDIEILEVFDDSIPLNLVPKKENQYILDHIEVLGVNMIINRRWVVAGKEVYSNAGMKYKNQKVSDQMQGMVLVKDSEGNKFRVSKEEFDERDDLVGIGKWMKFYHNPETMDRIKIEADEVPPEGYVSGIGKNKSDKNKAEMSKRRTNTTVINNGVVNKIIHIDEEIPEGWVKGHHSKRKMPGWSEERRLRRAETMRRKTEERLKQKSTLEGF